MNIEAKNVCKFVICFFLQGHGFWFVYPNQPWDASKGLGMMELYEAMHTAIFEFDNNVAHSYKKVNDNCQLIQIVYVLYFDKKQIF